MACPTSVLAAEHLKDDRQVIGCELMPEYIGVTIQRWIDLTGGIPKLVAGLEPRRAESS